MKKHALAAIGATLLMSGCASGLKIPLKDALVMARNNAAVISFNGLLSDENRRATGRMARDSGMLHFHGGPRGKDELEALRNASNVYITAHSAGDDAARNYARFLDKHNIAVREMYFFDSCGNGSIPDNVREVTDIHSTGGAWVRSRHNGAGYVEVRDSNHFNGPTKGMSFVKKDIKYHKGSTRDKR